MKTSSRPPTQLSRVTFALHGTSIFHKTRGAHVSTAEPRAFTWNKHAMVTASPLRPSPGISHFFSRHYNDQKDGGRCGIRQDTSSHAKQETGKQRNKNLSCCGRVHVCTPYGADEGRRAAEAARPSASIMIAVVVGDKVGDKGGGGDAEMLPGSGIFRRLQERRCGPSPSSP